MREPEDDPGTPRQRRKARFAGIRLVGIFVPWQAVALTLALVVALTAVATLRSSGSSVRVEQASSDTPAHESSSTTSSSTSSSTTTPTQAPTTTTQAPTTTTTVAPTTTTTTIPPGSAEVVIFGGGVSYGDGMCNEPSDWDFLATCEGQMPLREELVFSLDPRRYPKGARFFLDVVAGANHDATYCLRAFDLGRNAAVAGSERCWSSPAVPTPAPYTSWPPRPTVSERIPLQLPGAGRYTIQAKVSRASSGEPCHYGMVNCDGLLSRAKVAIEWG